MNPLRPSLAIVGCRVLVVLGCLSVPAIGAAAPEPWTPPGAIRFDPGPSLSVDGLSLRIAGFVTVDPPEQVLRAARALAKPNPVAESMLQGRRVVGWLEADHFVTVQVESAGMRGSRGLWAAVPVREAIRARSPVRPEADWLPTGSEFGPSIRTVDGQVEGLVLQGFNAHSTSANADHLIRRLRSDGFVLEQPSRSNLLPGSEPLESVMHFRGARGSQVTAIMRRESPGRTAVTVIRTGPRENPR